MFVKRKRKILPNACHPKQLHLDCIDETYDSIHYSKRVHWDHSTSFSQASDEIVVVDDHLFESIRNREQRMRI